MPYVQDYIKTHGKRKCEANAIVPMPRIAREFVENAITEFVGDDAESRFAEKRQAVKDDLDKFREETGLQDSLQKALDLINEAE